MLDDITSVTLHYKYSASNLKTLFSCCSKPCRYKLIFILTSRWVCIKCCQTIAHGCFGNLDHTSIYFIHSITGIIEYQKHQLYSFGSSFLRACAEWSLFKPLCEEVLCDDTIIKPYAVCFNFVEKWGLVQPTTHSTHWSLTCDQELL